MNGLNEVITCKSTTSLHFNFNFIFQLLSPKMFADRRVFGFLPVLGTICVLLLPFAGMAQSQKELEDKRKKLIRDIEVTDKLLKKTTKTKESTYDRYLALQNQIESRASLIQTIDQELQEADGAISRNTVVVASLGQDILKMQEEYGRMIRNGFRRKTLSNPLLYILSAASLNEAFRRWLFLRKYDQYRKQQAEAIAFTRDMLSRRIGDLAKTKSEKENLLLYLEGQKTMLTTELVDKDALLKNLGQDETRLKQDLQQKQQTHEALNQAIEKIIQEEVFKRVEESRKAKPAPAIPAPTKTETPVVATKPSTDKAEKPAAVAAPAEAVETDNLSRFFQLKRGKLPWPVDNGFVARPYGRQKHPTIKNIEITNNGIDIRTEESAEVRSIFEGKVAGVQFIPGHEYTVILQHGNYYTVYSNLSETKLTKGEQVSAKQLIGRVANNAITGTSELHFELWHEKERMNPALWIKK